MRAASNSRISTTTNTATVRPAVTVSSPKENRLLSVNSTTASSAPGLAIPGIATGKIAISVGVRRASAVPLAWWPPKIICKAAECAVMRLRVKRLDGDKPLEQIFGAALIKIDKRIEKISRARPLNVCLFGFRANDPNAARKNQIGGFRNHLRRAIGGRDLNKNLRGVP